MTSKGKGSIQKRDEEGFTWQLVISAGYDKNKKKIRHLKTVHVEGRTIDARRKAAERQLALFLAATERSDYIEPSKYTVDDFTQKWLSEYAEKTLEAKTFHRYKEILTGRVSEAMGHIKLQELKPMDLIKFYDNLQEKGIRKDTRYIAKPALKELIQSHSIGLEQLANEADISIRTINDILSGNVTIMANKICKAINDLHLIKTSETAQNANSTLKTKLNDLFIPANELKPLSNKTIQHYHRALSSMLNDAVQWQLIPSNPAARVQPPKAIKKEMPCFNEDQAELLLDLLEYEPIKYRALINLALTTGARRGEICALEWKDIDSDKNIIRIAKSVQYIPGEGLTIKQPKTKSSNRLISVPKSTIALMLEYKITQNAERSNAGDRWVGDDENGNVKYVFTTIFGELMHPDTISSWFPEFIERHNKAVINDNSFSDEDKKLYILPKTNFHSLRHSAATLLINQGLNVRALSNRLGHANTSTTMNIYAHSLQSADKQAADMMENIITRRKRNTDVKQA